VVASAQKQSGAGELTVANNELVQSSQAVKSSSEELLRLQEAELASAKTKIEQLRQLVSEGLVAKNELLAGEQGITAIEAKITATKQRIADSDRTVVDIRSREQQARVQAQQANAVVKYRSLNSPTILRYSGTTSWGLANLSQVQTFFMSRFGRLLPTSAIGQSATHNRFGYDHRHAVDVALHPDSSEGKALISYLQSQGIPFLAFRGAVPGVATGPHIHIGTPSHRLG